MPQEYKVKSVEILKEKLKKVPNFYLADYRGLTVQQLTTLRTKLREKSSEFTVVKNNLFRIALQESGFKSIDEFLKGPLGVAFISENDPVSPAKILTDLTRALKKQELFRIIGGYFEGNPVSSKEVTQLSTLPSKEVLLGQIMGCVQGPLRGIATCVQGPIRGIMQCVKALVDKNS